MRISSEKKQANGSRRDNVCLLIKHLPQGAHAHTGVCNINTGHKNQENIIDTEGKIKKGCEDTRLQTKLRD